MTCHSQVWRDAPMLAPVRESWAEQRPLQWTRVHDLPEYTYFDHSIHIAKGIGCTSCHGRIDQMPLTAKGASLRMRWCLECHRAPQEKIRPQSEVFNLNWDAKSAGFTPENQGRKMVHDMRVESLQNCSTCHR